MKRYGIVAALALALVLFAGSSPLRVGVGAGVPNVASIGGSPNGIGSAAHGARSLPIGILGNMDNEWHSNITPGNEDFFQWTIPDSVIPYADIARLSVKQVQPIMLDDNNPNASTSSQRWIGYVDSVRAYNPNFISLTYAFVFGFPWADSTSQTINGRFSAMCRRNDFEMRSTLDLGNLEVTQDPSFPAYTLINFMAPGVADSMANFHAEYWARSSNGQDYTGLMLDYGSCSIYDWECGGDFGAGMDCTDVIDMDRDNVPFSSDTDEQEFMETFWGDFMIKLRARMEELHGNDRFVLLLNGNAPFCDDVAAANLDGVYQEAIGESGKAGSNFWNPAQTANRELALSGGLAARFEPTPLRTPLLFMDMGRSREGRDDADMSLALAMVVPGGMANGHTENPNNKRTHFSWQHVDWNFGRPLALATQQGDTISRDYQHGYVRISMDGAWPYPYLGVITSGAELDTVMRGGGWPRETGPAPDLDLHLALADSCAADDYAWLRMTSTSPDSFSIEASISTDGGATWPITDGPDVSVGGVVYSDLFIAFDAGGCSEINGTVYYARYRTTDYTHGTPQTDWTVLGPFEYSSGAPPVDTTPPSAPALYAIPVDHYEHHLTWTASAATDFDHYEVYRSSAVLPSVPSTTLFADNILTNSFDFAWDQADAAVATYDTTHNWQVVAVDTLGNKSSKSNRRSDLVRDLVAPDAAPEFYVYAIAPTDADTAQVGMNWSAVEDTAGISYRTVYVSPDTDYGNMVLFGDGTESHPYAEFIEYDFYAAAFYHDDFDVPLYFSVKVLDLAGNASEFSGIDGTTWRVTPSVTAFNLDGLADDTGDVEITVSATFSREVTPELFVWRDNDDPASDAAKDSLDFSSGALIDSVAVTSTMAWPTADADSTFTVSWNRATPIPTSGYRVDGQRNNGSWITLADALVLGPTDSTLVVDADSGPGSLELRGKWLVRAYGVSGDTLSQVAVADSLLYNDAIEVHGYLRIYDTVSQRYGWSGTESVLGIVYPDEEADTTPPDTTGTFVSASIDTTDRTAATTGVIIQLGIDASEAVKSDFQWKALANGTYSAADDYDGAGFTAYAYTDTIPTLMSTDDFFTAADTTGGAGIYIRYRLKDAADNVSDYVRITGASDEALVFPRAAEAAGDTVLYIFSQAAQTAAFSLTANTPSAGRFRFTKPDGTIINVPEAYVVNATEHSSVLNPASASAIADSATMTLIGSSTVLPLAGTDVAGLLYFPIADSLSGMTVIRATLTIRNNPNVISAGNTLRAAGVIDQDLEAWTAASCASYNYYDAVTSSAWANAISTYSDWSFAAGYGDTILAANSTNTSPLHLDATESAQYWATNGSGGVFWIDLISAGSADTHAYYGVTSSSTGYRPVFWVLGVK